MRCHDLFGPLVDHREFFQLVTHGFVHLELLLFGLRVHGNAGEPGEHVEISVAGFITATEVLFVSELVLELSENISVTFKTLGTDFWVVLRSDESHKEVGSDALIDRRGGPVSIVCGHGVLRHVAQLDGQVAEGAH